MLGPGHILEEEIIQDLIYDTEIQIKHTMQKFWVG